jgi:hypothetical protein
VQPEREACDDTEVGAGDADRPEQVGVLVTARPADPAVGRHDLDLEQAVDRPAEAPGQVAEASAEREAGDAYLGEEPQHGRQPVFLRRTIDVPEQAASSHVGDARSAVDDDLAHPGHVDRQAELGDRGARDVVTASLDAEEKAVLTGEVTTSATSPAARGCTTSAGAFDASPFQIRTASSQSWSPAHTSDPSMRARRSSS